MKTLPSLTRYSLLLLCGATLALSACKKDTAGDDPSPSGDGTVTWTHNGVTYTDNFYAGAIVDPGDKIFIVASSKDRNNVLSIPLLGINAKGKGVYDLRRGSVLDDYSIGSITLNGADNKSGATYSTLYGPSASNGTVTVTEFDKNAQKLSGTFSFTAGAVPLGNGSGTQSVTNGSFSIHKFH
ncbi:DUF6252 family protein [Hymenobacter properus]|uniref:Uncharacterized protein n=1 Tax=Hymenobacter properus TaxID=2791026 RepID=A0A931BH40_9BACT|nr:DUF6252 family protein [Hymenobacter properus]MBF9142356.1 hypothetical protein [Hymenobacter properus]MBR7721163.1 hypothetical protein [Microvirga sp. SRT04]